MRGFLSGVIAAVLVLILASVALVYSGYIPANADAKPSQIERLAAHIALNATIAREAPTGAAPIAVSDASLTQGAQLYSQNCAICHGGADHKLSSIALGLFQKPPQFIEDDVTDDSVGETYWKIHHGIRLTGMPAYNASLTDTQQWQIALFLKHMNELPVHAHAIWKTMKTPGSIVAKAHVNG